MGRLRRPLAFCLLAAVIGVNPFATSLVGQENGERKVKSQVKPTYPSLARKMRLSGKVKVEVVIAPDGKVKSTHVIGGPPVFVDAVMDAVQHWKFEPGPKETTQVLQFKFVLPDD